MNWIKLGNKVHKPTHAGEDGSKIATDLKCCCDPPPPPPPEGCCSIELPDTLCATVFTTNCNLSTGGTVTIELTEVYSNADDTIRVWDGSGVHSPDVDSEIWYIQVLAVCDEADDSVYWYLCEDQCTIGAFRCSIAPPDATDPDWQFISNQLVDEDCLDYTFYGVPLSSCTPSGYDCEFEVTVTTGACPSP